MRHRVRNGFAVLPASLVASAVARPRARGLQNLQPPLGLRHVEPGCCPPLAAQRAKRVQATRARTARSGRRPPSSAPRARTASNTSGPPSIQPALEAQLLVLVQSQANSRTRRSASQRAPPNAPSLARVASAARRRRRTSDQSRVPHGGRRERRAARGLGAPQRAHGAFCHVQDAHLAHAVRAKRVVARERDATARSSAEEPRFVFYVKRALF